MTLIFVGKNLVNASYKRDTHPNQNSYIIYSRASLDLSSLMCTFVLSLMGDIIFFPFNTYIYLKKRIQLFLNFFQV